MTPRLEAREAPLPVAFVQQAFGATGDCRSDRPAVLTIGDSMYRSGAAS